ncbi:helix-turn-helix domain-containing protein [Planococcus kocurii]
MSDAHMILRERVRIECYCLKEKSLSYIAKQLERSKSTIHYEVKRCKLCDALLAQADYEARPELDDYILSKLKLDWSPECLVTVLENASKNFSHPCFERYRYAALGLFNLSQKLLIRKKVKE